METTFETTPTQAPAAPATVETSPLDLAEYQSGEGYPETDPNYSELPPLDDGHDWDLAAFNQEFTEPGQTIEVESYEVDEDEIEQKIIDSEASFFVASELEQSKTSEQAEIEALRQELANPALARLEQQLDLDNLATSEVTEVAVGETGTEELEQRELKELAQLNQAEAETWEHQEAFVADQREVQREFDNEYIEQLAADPEAELTVLPESQSLDEYEIKEEAMQAEAYWVTTQEQTATQPEAQEAEAVETQPMTQAEIEELTVESGLTLRPQLKEQINQLILVELVTQELESTPSAAAQPEAVQSQKVEQLTPQQPERQERLKLFELQTAVESGLPAGEQLGQQVAELARLVRILQEHSGGISDQKTERAEFTYDGEFTDLNELLTAIEDQYAVTAVALMLYENEHDLLAFQEAVEETFDDYYDQLLIELPEDETGEPLTWERVVGQPATIRIEHEIKADQTRSLIITYPTQQVGGTHGDAQSAAVPAAAVSTGTTKQTRLTVQQLNA